MTHRDEIARAERFAFGDNWARFLASVDERRIATAEESLRVMLRVSSLEGSRQSEAAVECGCRAS